MTERNFVSIFLYHSPFFEGKIEKNQEFTDKIPTHCENPYSFLSKWKIPAVGSAEAECYINSNPEFSEHIHKAQYHSRSFRLRFS